MNYKLVKLNKYSGSKASVYTIQLINEDISLLERFVEENIILHKDETKNVLERLIIIGHKTGAREQFFKLKEGKPGDGVAALYDEPDSNLRLYCIRYGSLIVIVGGGGHKPKSIKTLQEDPKLTAENAILVKVSKDIQNRTKEGEIRFINDGMDFEGDIEFIDEFED
jgi:hypothetical protein